MVRRSPLEIRQRPRRERSGQAWVFCVVVLGHSLLELATKARLQTQEVLEVREPVPCCILAVLRQHGLQDTRCFWICWSELHACMPLHLYQVACCQVA